MNADLRPIAGGPRRAAARSLVRTDLAQSIRWLLVVALALVGAVAQPADAEQIDYARFDHTSTGFPLDGRHQNLRCEQCHINGAFEGTPRECRACHIQGNTRSTMVVPVNHLPLTYWLAPESGPAVGVTPVQSTDCTDCHTTTSFGGAHYAHTNVMPGTCAGCHKPNGKGVAMGIPQGHIALNSAGAALGSQPGTSCDECHTTVSFGAQYLIFPSGHIPVGATACTNCHVGTVAPYTPAYTQMNHSGLTSSCAGCHGTGKRFLGTAQTEIGGQPLQPPGAVGAPGAANHIPYASADCVSCHSASSTSQGGFKITATPSVSATGHAAVNSLTCATCHASGDTWYGVTIVVPPGTVGTSGAANHIALGTGDCKTCHASSFTTGGFKITTTPALAATGHAAVASVSCASCHGTGSAWYGVPTLVAQLGNHIPIAGGTCSACHGSNFVTGGFHINGTPGTTPVLSPANHAVVASLTCSTCHENNATDLGFQGVLTQIYVRPGAVAAGLSPVDAGHATGTLATNDCVQCHGTSPPFAAVKPPTNHIPLPTGAACSTCHSAGYSPTLSKMVHSVVTSETCATCHASGKGPFAGTGPGTGGQPVQPPGTVGASGAGNHIPVGTSDCVACHASTDTESGTGFKLTTSPLLSSTGHTAVNSLTCATCHAAGDAWYGVTIITPPGTVGTQGAANHIALGTGDCSACHGTTIAVGAFKITATPALSAAGHAVVGSLTCATCHYAAGTPGNVAWYGTSALAPPGAVGTSGAANHIALGTGDCVTCHGSNFGTGGFHITTTPALAATGHAAVASASCASCHGTGSAWYGVPTLVTQLGNHIPIASGTCSACHGSSFVTGGFHINGTPGTTPVLSVANHTVVASLTCSTCHENNPTDLGFQGVLTQIYVRPGSVAAGLSPVDAAHGTGTLATADCAGCHNTSPPFSGNQLPSNHFPLPTGTVCTGCHAAGFTPTTSKMIHSLVTSETCATCHGSGKGPFSGTGPGTGGQPVQPPGTVGTSGAGNHIPVGTSDCVACHASTDTESGTGFKLTTSPLLSSTGHTAVNALTCAICHASGDAWYGVTIAVPPGTVGTSGTANHIALGTGDCVTCHGGTIAVGAFKITTTPALAATGHTAVSSLSCASCHGTGSAWYGVPTLVTQLGNHIPIASATCSACHGSSFVTGGFHISGTPGTTPVLSVANHTLVASLTCSTCHENNATDLGYQGVLTQIYVRPGAVAAGLSPVDANHATGTLASGDCAQCHNTTPPFTGSQLPSNHFPLPTGATCVTCHAAGYGVGKSIMVHSAVSPAESCLTCHASGKGPFAGTSQGTGGQPMQPPGTVGTSGTANHIPIGSSDCGTACHATVDAMTGTGFKLTMLGNANAHGAVSSLTCAGCHGAGLAWYGVTIKTPPGTAGTPGAGNHLPLLPSGADCKTCHSASGFSSFSGTAMNHSTIASGCATCHATGDTWYGVTNLVTDLATHIPISTADCSSCHSLTFTTGGFKITSSPVLSVAAHAVVTGLGETCNGCHNNTAADLAFQGVGSSIYVRPGATAAGLSPADALHAVGNLLSQDCSACHTTTPPFTGSSKPSNHIPSSATCTNCHTGYTPATTAMNHADSGVGTAGTPVACATCHGYGAGPYYGTAQGQAGGQPLQPPGTNGGAPSTSQHIPTGTAACNICHTSTTVPGGFAGATVPHTSGPFMTYTSGKSGSSTPTCKSCHGPSGAKWYNVSISTATVGSHQGSTTSQDCINCHGATGNQFGGAAAAAARRAQTRATHGATSRPGSTTTVPATGPNARKAFGAGPYSHLGVTPGSCAGCHSAAGGAPAMPGGHLPTALSCDACHRTTAWAPATYAHAGIGPGHCASCHAGVGNWATAKPSAHFVTARSCDVCHHSTGSWEPVMYDHLSPRYVPQVGFVRCIDCHTTNTEMVVAAARAGGRRAMPGGPIRH